MIKHYLTKLIAGVAFRELLEPKKSVAYANGLQEVPVIEKQLSRVEARGHATKLYQFYFDKAIEHIPEELIWLHKVMLDFIERSTYNTEYLKDIWCHAECGTRE